MATLSTNIKSVRAELIKGLKDNQKFKKLIQIIRDGVPGGKENLTDAVMDEIYAEAVTQVLLLQADPGGGDDAKSKALYDYFSVRELDRAAPRLAYQLEDHQNVNGVFRASVKGVTIPDIQSAIKGQNFFNITAFFDKTDFEHFNVDNRNEAGLDAWGRTDYRSAFSSGKITEDSFNRLLANPGASEKLSSYLVTNFVVTAALDRADRSNTFFSRQALDTRSTDLNFLTSGDEQNPDNVINSIFNLFMDFPNDFVKEVEYDPSVVGSAADAIGNLNSSGNPYTDDGLGIRASNSFRTALNQVLNAQTGALRHRTAVTVSDGADGQIGDLQNPDNTTKALEAVETLKIHTQCVLLQTPDVMASRFNKCYPRTAFQNQSGTPAIHQTPADPEELNNLTTQAVYSSMAGQKNQTTNLYTQSEAAGQGDPGWSVDSRGHVLMHCKDPAQRPRNYSAIDVLETGAAGLFLNSISTDRKAINLNELPTQLLAMAVPYVKMFIVKRDSSDNPISIELPINSLGFQRRSDLLKQNKIVLQNFQIKFLGTNPAEVDNYVKADATFFVPSFSSMGDERNANNRVVDGKLYQAKFIDLITRSTQVTQFPGSQNPAETINHDIMSVPTVNPVIEQEVQNKHKEEYKEYWNPDHFQVKVEYGLKPITKSQWATIFSTGQDRAAFAYDAVNDAIRANKIEASLTLMKHTIAIDEEYQYLTLKVEYIGHVESMLRSHMADVFKNNARDAGIIKQHRQALEELQQQKAGFSLSASTEDGAKRATRELTKLQEEVQSIEKDLKISRWSGLLNALIDTDKIFSVKVDSDDMGLKFNVSNQSTTLTVANGRQNASILEAANVTSGATKKELSKKFEIQDATTEEALNTLSVESSTSKFDKNLRTFKFYYFYLGDLIDVAIDNIKAQNPRFKIGNNNADLQFVVGPYDYFDPVTHTPKVVNISDLPISLDLYYSWFIKRVIKPDRARYNFAQFIRDIVSDLITSIMAEDCLKMPENTLKKINAQYKRPRFSASLLNVSDSKLPPNAPSRLLIPAGGIFWDAARVTRRTSYYVISASSSNASLNLSGKKNTNTDQGIVHFNLQHLNIGVLRSAKFKKTDIPYMGEARVLQDSVSISQFRDKYDVDIVCHGNNIFRPGQYIFLETADKTGDPLSQEGSWARTFGFGGYYLVNSVTHALSFDQVIEYETRLEGIWQSAGAPTLRI